MELSEQLVVLVAELLDAHDDTLRLSQDLVLDERWEAHLCYLRDLRSVGHEALVQSCRAGCGTGRTRRIESTLTRRGDRRCARDGHGEGSA
jgi:hypothetical protein